MPGLLPTGLDVPTLEQILAQIQSEQLASPAIGPNVDVSETSALGQINGIVANQLRVAWEALGGIYNGLNPDSNGGTIQDNVAAITGTTRRSATPSRTEHDVTLAAGTYPALSLAIRPVGTTIRSKNPEEITTAGGVVTDVIFQAETVGETSWSTATTWEIASPVLGFSAVTNATAVTNGTNVETDAQLRLRRELEAQGGSGSTTVDAIRAALLTQQSLGVISATVYENVTGVVDSRGVAPYSVEAVVFGPESPTSQDDINLANAIFLAKAGGVKASGTQEEVILDTQGNEHVIGFSRPVAVPVKSAWTLRVQGGVFDETSVKEAIAAYAEDISPGEELQWSAFICAGRQSGVLDVVGMTQARVADTLSMSNVVTTVREYVIMDVANISITIVP